MLVGYTCIWGVGWSLTAVHHEDVGVDCEICLNREVNFCYTLILKTFSQDLNGETENELEMHGYYIGKILLILTNLFLTWLIVAWSL